MRKMQTALDWKSEIGVTAGITQLIDWVEQNRDAFRIDVGIVVPQNCPRNR